MRLLRVYVDGYKRFGSKTGFTVDAPVVALVGPNEAGKSSVLEALAHLHSDDAMEQGKLTRGRQLDDDHPLVSAVFLLEDADREAITDIPEAGAVRSVRVYKTLTGSRYMVALPTVTRDTSSRDRVAASLRKAGASPSLRERRWDDESLVAPFLLDLASQLEQASETLTEQELAALTEVVEPLSELVSDDDPGYVRELSGRLLELLEIERLPRPAKRLADVIFPRLPRFEWFGSEARSLRSSYVLTELSEDVPAALANLARLAGLDVPRLIDAVSAGRRGEVQELQEQANARLEVAYGDAWSQGRLSVSFNVDEEARQVFVREEGGSYWEMAERSDGLRWFVALVALLAQQDATTPPILLIDEAEQHLHYDAQADLIRMFQEQITAAGVIYTTHSAGCLPQDIGAGVKVVRRVDRRHSTIKNGFWVDGPGTADEAGFSSVLMEMGASTLAFSSARHAVFCEGRTELVLLPSVLREACEWRTLPFQVAPGLASVNPSVVPHLDLAAARVAFLVDGDDAGAKVAKKLRRAGVPAERICRVATSTSNPTTIEDFIDARVHRDAMQQELRTSGLDVELPLSVFGSLGRAARLDRWFQDRDLPQPHKVAVAHHIVSQAREGTVICDSRRRGSIARIGRTLSRILDVDGRA